MCSPCWKCALHDTGPSGWQSSLGSPKSMTRMPPPPGKPEKSPAPSAQSDPSPARPPSVLRTAARTRLMLASRRANIPSRLGRAMHPTHSFWWGFCGSFQPLLSAQQPPLHFPKDPAWSAPLCLPPSNLLPLSEPRETNPNPSLLSGPHTPPRLPPRSTSTPRQAHRDLAGGS